jgi:hypothetical protein
MTAEEEIRWIREAQFKMMDQIDILWRIIRKDLPDEQEWALDEMFRYHCGLEHHHTKEAVAKLPGLTQEDRDLIVRERMLPRSPTPREQLLERLVQVMFDPDAPSDEISSLRKALNI